MLLTSLAFVVALPGNSEGAAIRGGGLLCRISDGGNLLSQIETRSRKWLHGPVQMQVRNEATGAAEVAAWSLVREHGTSTLNRASFSSLNLTVSGRISGSPKSLAVDFEFQGAGKRAGHTVTFDWPILDRDLRIFTPSERGLMEVDAYPSFAASPYGNPGTKGRAYVLPLVSVMDPRSGEGLTIALPADANTPHLEVSWTEGRVLHLALGHRGMGSGPPSSLRLLLFSHAADYRSVLKAYSDLYPAYFEPALPRGPYEGAFWYHHIQEHPDLAELKAQGVRYLWSSFWFTHLGEYLPDAQEWYPYTYAKDLPRLLSRGVRWSYGETMSDGKINRFVDSMRKQGIGTYAYFNLTEYGGAGGSAGNPADAQKALRERFADAIIRNQDGREIPSWEGAMVMNPGKQFALWPFLQQQVERHVRRLPGLAGFIIDRLDWASKLDYAHDDGLTMVGEKAAENLAVPVAEAVQAVCRTAHAGNIRVFLNQFYRVEVLRDADGVCAENDYLPALAYLTPFRPASAWHLRRKYTGDLLAFEAQMKRRLHWALFPHMITRKFPMSQQVPEPRGADFLELYAPLFERLDGKRQVLEPNCVRADGANDVNLFLNRSGDYVVPLTSRVRFLVRGDRARSPVAVTVNVADAAALRWAHVYTPDGDPYRATLSRSGGRVVIVATQHGTASVIVAGKGKEPALAAQGTFAPIRERLREGHGEHKAPTSSPAPDIKASAWKIRISGEHVGERGDLKVLVNGHNIGSLAGDDAEFLVSEPAKSALLVELRAGDEGIWFVPRRAELMGQTSDGQWRRFAAWLPDDASEGSDFRGHTKLVLKQELVRAHQEGRN